jgi:hypothetical protein
MRVLVACELSGVVRDAFVRAGHSAYSCDIEDSESRGLHYKGDVLDLLEGWAPVRFSQECQELQDEVDLEFCPVSMVESCCCYCYGPTQEGIEYKEVEGGLLGRPVARPHWDLIIAHPPCTYLCSSGLHWNKRIEGRTQKTEDALKFVWTLLDAPCEKIALENPRGCIGTRIRHSDQVIQPYQFGHDASKETHLWLKNLPLLEPTGEVLPRWVNGKPRWINQLDSGQNRLGPSKDRARIRSRTYEGIAAAMAAQWGDLDV